MLAKMKLKFDNELQAVYNKCHQIISLQKGNNMLKSSSSALNILIPNEKIYKTSTVPATNNDITL